MKLITGQYKRKVDNKGRVVIPSEMRVPGKYYARKSEHTVALYPEKFYEELAKKFLERDVFDKERVDFANVMRLGLDAQGRINIGRVLEGVQGRELSIRGNLDCILISEK